MLISDFEANMVASPNSTFFSNFRPEKKTQTYLTTTTINTNNGYVNNTVFQYVVSTYLMNCKCTSYPI